MSCHASLRRWTAEKGQSQTILIASNKNTFIPQVSELGGGFDEVLLVCSSTMCCADVSNQQLGGLNDILAFVVVVVDEKSEIVFLGCLTEVAKHTDPKLESLG
jgi:hypothetical protein